MPATIRPATPADAPVLVELILELADYEKLTHEAVPDASELAAHLEAQATPRVEALVAEAEGRVVGFALFFSTYSTFLTRWGIYLEDLYVRPESRGAGVGFALLREVARIAVARGCRRLEWSVLDWNQPAIDFYRRLGTQEMPEWDRMRLSGPALEALGRY